MIGGGWMRIDWCLTRRDFGRSWAVHDSQTEAQTPVKGRGTSSLYLRLIGQEITDRPTNYASTVKIQPCFFHIRITDDRPVVAARALRYDHETEA